MTNEASHVHQRLLSEDFAIMPPADLHHLGFVADLDQSLTQAGRPSIQELERILTQSEGVAQPEEVSHFLEHDYLKASAVHCQSRRTSSKPGTDDNDYRPSISL